MDAAIADEPSPEQVAEVAGYHSCSEACCEKRPGEYCKDDECNCGADGGHATLPKPEEATPAVVIDLSPPKIVAPEIVLSEQQNEAKELVKEWLNGPEPEFRLGGYAGTGKTTLLKKLLTELNIPTEVCSFTGKAVSVLRKKGMYGARTLHNLLYKYEFYDGRYHMIPKPRLYDCDLIVVDEASMVSQSLYDDLKRHRKKMLFVGDPAQLEPVGANPNLVKHCDYVLTKIHRQADKSPILRLAQAVRNGLHTIPNGVWERGEDGDLYVLDEMEELEDTFDVTICGKNVTRHRINSLRRRQRGRTEALEDGDIVLCLENNRELGVFNGMTFTIKKIQKQALFEGVGTIFADLVDDVGQEYLDIPIRSEFFGKDFKRDFNRDAIAFDYGYALTAHKSQGSEWDNVLAIDEPVYGCDTNRWRYTTITRAAKRLTYLK